MQTGRVQGPDESEREYWQRRHDEALADATDAEVREAHLELAENYRRLIATMYPRAIEETTLDGPI